MTQKAERRLQTVIGGKWRLDSLLGSGSMAAVYAATHRNGARAALKILHPNLCTDPSVCERFLGEGYLANSVKHPGIVRVLDDGVTDDGCVFLVMDLLEGDTLEALRVKRGGRIPLGETLEIADKILDAMGAVHGAGVIHRDLKPQNVFVCTDGTVKILDFGVARVFDRTSQSKLSIFGLVLGTPSFMSPEQALGSREKVDHRSDIWSVGATLFTALSGETVHLGANLQAKLLAAATVKARSITMVMHDMHPALASAIDTALRFKKDDRWQTIDAMRRAIRDAAAAMEGDPAFAGQIQHSIDTPPAVTADVAAPARALDAMRTQKMTSVAPPPLPSIPPEGPGGTFIGIGEAGGKLRVISGSDAPPPLDGKPELIVDPASIAPPPQTERTARIAPAPFPESTPIAAAEPERVPAQPAQAHEGSIPAYGSSTRVSSDDSLSSLDPQAAGGRKKGSVGVWLAAVVIAIIAIGGVGFFAVRDRATAQPPPVETPEPPPAPPESLPPSVSANPAPSAAPTTAESAAPPAEDTAPAAAGSASVAAVKTAEPPRRPVVPVTPPRVVAPPVAHPPQRPQTPPPARTTSQPTAEPTHAAPPEKPAPPGLAPDPFGTPE